VVFPLWLGVLVVVREVVLSLWVIYVTYRGVPRMDVTWFGKKGTFFTMLAFPSILISTDTEWPGWVTTFFAWVGWAAVPFGVVFSFIALFQYVDMGIKGLRKLDSA
jgi:phosphatidylglycerophosphate synthase